MSLRLNASTPLSTTSPTIATGRAAVADLERARRDRRAARIGLVGGEREDAGAPLDERARAADDRAKRDVVAAIERQRAVVDDIADDAAGGAAIAELQRAGADRRRPV